ncbi:hypothetical protein [Symbioplanes lichenis]|uniref:hypothetical protein n=1 Tax=Symbioplanes lichenis TaxID=1629072 RepID=UPI00273839E1|nr:hypothetical protein [Actinoplanes lichenis]
MSACAITVCGECVAVGRRPVDPAGQAARLRAAAGHRVRLSRCLDVCSQANVVIVQPSPSARRGGARPVWLGLVEGGVEDDVVAWVRAGGPGVAPLPVLLSLSEIAPPVRERRA